MYSTGESIILNWQENLELNQKKDKGREGEVGRENNSGTLLVKEWTNCTQDEKQ
jgi:hypothetical protein